LVPRAFCGWNNRFDDPRREYRTLYAAHEPRTALREVLADLRPNAEAIAEFGRLFGGAGRIPAGLVTWRWRRERALAQGRIAPADARLVDLDDLTVRRKLEREHAHLLATHRLRHLDISEIRSRTRPVTQAISRSLYDAGAAGVRFRSNLDDLLCVALFEGRAALEPIGEPLRLTEDLPDLRAVCQEFGLRLGSKEPAT